MFKKETYIARREQLRKDVGHGIIIIQGNHEAPCNYPDNTYWFRQDSTFLYFFGLQREDLIGVLDCDSGKDYLFANDYDIDDVIWTGPLPSVKELAASVGVENSGSLADLEKFIKDSKHSVLNSQFHYLPPYRADNRRQLSMLLGLKYDAVPQYASMPLILACVKQRSIKSEEEIVEIEKAIATAYNMHVGAMRMAMPGRYEYELAGFMQGEAWKGNGPVSFPVIMTIHGETLHNHNHNHKLELGRMLVMDAGCETEMSYCSDITRSVPVGGKFDDRQRAIGKQIHETVLSGGKTCLCRSARPAHTILGQGAGAREKESARLSSFYSAIEIQPKRRLVKRRRVFREKENIRHGAGCRSAARFLHERKMSLFFPRRAAMDKAKGE